jgi:transposase
LSLHVLFPHLRSFRLLSAQRETDSLTLTCERVTRTARCPICGTVAHRIHSRYMRTVRDLSVQKVQVILHLHVRKFYCDHRECQQRVFDLPASSSDIPSWSLYLWSARQFLGQLGREHGGASGAKSATLSGIQVTPRAILRFMHTLALAPISAPRIIGLDDWAWKRGQRYGAVIIDLERSQPIARLSDRSQPTVAQWLRDHPTIQMVARDRSKEFTAAITETLPKALHVADRWHLTKNLTKWLDKVVSARWKQLTKARDEAESSSEPASPPALSPRQSPGEARYQQMLALRQAGYSTASIARRLGVVPRTLQYWLTQKHGPYTQPRKPRRNSLDGSSMSYLRERWDAGERNGALLWQGLKDQGYKGSMRTVYRHVENLREHSAALPPSPLDGATPAKIIGWLLALYWLLGSSVQKLALQDGERSSSPTCKHRRVGVESGVVDSILMLEQRHSHVMEKMFYGRCFHHSPAAEG